MDRLRTLHLRRVSSPGVGGVGPYEKFCKAELHFCQLNMMY
jgi:hypothetical protein